MRFLLIGLSPDHLKKTSPVFSVKLYYTIELLNQDGNHMKTRHKYVFLMYLTFKCWYWVVHGIKKPEYSSVI